jgi:hypothetical protein
VAAVFAALLDPSLAKLATDAARAKKAQKKSKVSAGASCGMVVLHAARPRRTLCGRQVAPIEPVNLADQKLKLMQVPTDAL